MGWCNQVVDYYGYDNGGRRTLVGLNFANTAHDVTFTNTLELR
jgi:hypothetical protein